MDFSGLQYNHQLTLFTLDGGEPCYYLGCCIMGQESFSASFNIFTSPLCAGEKKK